MMMALKHRLKDSRILHWTGILLLISVLLLGVILGALSIAYMTAGSLYEYEDTVSQKWDDPLPEVDAIVILAGARGRIREAGNLWGRYHEAYRSKHLSRLPFLYLSGMGQGADWKVVEGRLNPSILRNLSPERVILENQSTNTLENAEYLRDEVKMRQWTRILLVTSSYHMRRSRYVFEQVLNHREPQRNSEDIDDDDQAIQIETYTVYQQPFLPNQWYRDFYGIRVTLMEYFKWIFYRAFR